MDQEYILDPIIYAQIIIFFLFPFSISAISTELHEVPSNSRKIDA